MTKSQVEAIRALSRPACRWSKFITDPGAVVLAAGALKRMVQSVKPRVTSVVLALCALTVTISINPPASALGNDNKVMLQWFETSWSNIEYRMPDMFMSGYGAVWLPPPSIASTGSPGYDVFDRFNLGRPGSETQYGTEERFRRMVAEMKAADVDVYIDAILNHNSSRTTNAQFIADGAWPGFYLPGQGANFWGDFNDGTTQSENPSASNYNLFNGDLVSLIDINQATNFSFIRQPIGANAQNIPPGNVRNRPDAANIRFYPDRQLMPTTFTNPAPRGDGRSWTIYPYNTGTPSAGDAVAENATGLLIRWSQWMLEVHQVDGFRLDAAKHIPQWFWNNYFDPAMFNRRTIASGAKVTAFSFGESVAGNDLVQTYIRKDGFGNRDALDLNGAGTLRDIHNARGFRSWQEALNAAIDSQDDGLNNGTQGVNHVFSHDNGSVGSGSAAPSLPTTGQYAMVQNAFAIFRSGFPLVYYNSREMHSRFSSRGFWPREGNPTAIGDLDGNLRRLVQVHNGYARGGFFVLNSSDTVNPSLVDVLVFERGNGVAANVLVGVNDRYDNGFQQRSVLTSFPAGTRLQELSGAAADGTINNQGAIPQVLVVGGDRRVLLTVPNNANSAGVQHHRGYVVYGPASPTGTLSVAQVGGPVGAPGVIAADDVSVPSFRRRNTPMTLITSPQFELRLDTTKTDAADTQFDDQAIFRFNQGFIDLNGNGSFDLPASGLVDAGYERFLTQSSPISGPGGTGTTGLYRQVISTNALPEGPNYLSVIAYRRRTDGGLPVYRELRQVFYVDRTPPQVQLQDVSAAISSGNFEFRVNALDRTTNAVHILPNLAVGVDPVPLCSAANLATQHDRLEWRRNVGNLPSGNNSLTIVAFERSGNLSVQRVENIQVLIGSGDVNGDGIVTVDDLYSLLLIPNGTLNSNPAYNSAGDINRNGQIDATDKSQFEQAVLRLGESARSRNTQR